MKRNETTTKIVACILFCVFIFAFVCAGIMCFCDEERRAAWEIVAFICFGCACIHAVVMNDEEE